MSTSLTHTRLKNLHMSVVYFRLTMYSLIEISIILLYYTYFFIMYHALIIFFFLWVSLTFLYLVSHLTQ